LVEYKSPDDAATQEDLIKLEIYGALHIYVRAWRNDTTMLGGISTLTVPVQRPPVIWLSLAVNEQGTLGYRLVCCSTHAQRPQPTGDSITMLE